MPMMSCGYHMNIGMFLPMHISNSSIVPQLNLSHILAIRMSHVLASFRHTRRMSLLVYKTLLRKFMFLSFCGSREWFSMAVCMPYTVGGSEHSAFIQRGFTIGSQIINVGSMLSRSVVSSALQAAHSLSFSTWPHKYILLFCSLLMVVKYVR